MKTKKQLRREITAAEREIIRLQNANNRLQTENELLLGNLSKINEEKERALAQKREARKTEADARELVDKLLYVNDVLCAELQDCDRCIDTVRMALEQKSAHAELLNRITGPLV